MAVSAWTSDRGVIAVGGPDAVPFLQGLISNDVTKVGSGRTIYSALLTPQGKFLHDFFVVEVGDMLFLDCVANRRDDLFTRLKRYRLRSKVELSDVTADWAVGIAWGEDVCSALDLSGTPGEAVQTGQGIAFTDPRLAALGVRLLIPQAEAGETPAGFDEGSHAEYQALRVGLGVPDGEHDLEVDRSFLLESGFDELNGIDWQKGCYVGQEVTARTKYRGLVRRRLTPIEIDGDLLDEKGRIMANGKDAGEVRSTYGNIGLALLKLDAVRAGEPLTSGSATIRPHIPEWWHLPDGPAEEQTGTA
jgi:tRNA-modifying protein YgfZ